MAKIPIIVLLFAILNQNCRFSTISRADDEIPTLVDTTQQPKESKPSSKRSKKNRPVVDPTPAPQQASTDSSQQALPDLVAFFPPTPPKTIRTGAEQIGKIMTAIHGRKVSLVVNQTSMVGTTHLVDTLLASGVHIASIYAPEHGFRGQADAGATINSSVDPATGIPILSLYGASKKPTPDQLVGVELLVFDIQDVGARFYTYISTLHYVMEAAAENGIPLLVLDRPNPNGHYVDGPILETNYTSFVGMHPVPIVHGMTIAEYARMINGQSWLANGITCNLQVVPCEGYNHQTVYVPPIPPSPNLRTVEAMYLYPSLCFFEGTVISVGRGTDMPFQVYGHPALQNCAFQFTPLSKPGASKPPHENATCLGVDLRVKTREVLQRENKLNLSFLLHAYQNYPKPDSFFLANGFFEKLAGTSLLREQIVQNVSEEAIRASWQPALNVYKDTRKRYLLYAE